VAGWAFTALGTPTPAGSKSAFVNPKTGRAQVADDSKSTKAWRSEMMDQAPDGPMLDGPIAVCMVFTVPRPKSTPKKVTIPSTKPDVVKLARNAEDGITAKGLWRDDGRVAEYVRLSKVWPGLDPYALHVPGLVVAAVEMGDGWRPQLRELFLGALNDRLRRAGVA
jgi:crossover junction endodeoxyribonuclease RusA